MKAIIIYGSQYGTTKRYAQKLSELTGIQAESYDKVQNILDYEKVVYLGGLYAGGVKGLKQSIKLMPLDAEFIIITVGLADTLDNINTENIRKSVQKQIPDSLYDKAKLFFLRGGIDYAKLNFKHKTMMALLYKSIKETPAEKRTAEGNAIIETYNQKVDFVNFDSLIPIAQLIKIN